jgi:hypothetical protein
VTQPQRRPSAFTFKLSELRHEFRQGTWKVMLPILLLLLVFLALALKFGWNLKAVAAVTFAIGLLSNLFVWLLALIAVVPVVGPLVAKVLALPFIWLLNGLGYLVSYIAIRRGYTQDVITYRALTLALMLGIIIGFLLGNLF